jgi:molybdopterin-guanine dinucleotide biosynthesis protein A
MGEELIPLNYNDGSVFVNYSAVILSGGESSRLGVDKGLFRVFQKPLLAYVIEKVNPLVNEVVIVIRDRSKVEEYSRLFPLAEILTDEYDFKATISGVLTGFKKVNGEFSLLLPCDTPLVSLKLLRLLLALASGYDAVIPRWPNGYIEPLQAVYKTKTTLQTCLKSVENGDYKLRNMISRLHTVLYLSTDAINAMDPDLLTFYNVNNIRDIKEIKKYLRSTNQ